MRLPAAAPILAMTLTTLTLAACKTDLSGPSLGGSFCLGDCPFTYDIPLPKVSLVPSAVAGGLSFKAISLGARQVCGITTTGDVYCWGDINVGTSDYHLARSPERVPSDAKFDTISLGDGLACAIATDKRTMCWGRNWAGQVGNGTYGSPVLTPTAVYGREEVTSIAVGGWDVSGGTDGWSSFACGLTRAGAAFCWGTNALGQLGTGGATSETLYVAPFPVAGGHTFASLAGIGYAHACALDAGGGAYCWGRGGYEEFGGLPDGVGPFAPMRVVKDLAFVTLSTGGATCGITTTRDTYCWGDFWITDKTGVTPKLITSIPLVSIATGREHGCGLTASGVAYCWGSNGSGQLGNGTTSSSEGAVPVATDLRFVRIAVGPDQTCALTSTGAAYCWGSDDWSGMLGGGV